MLVGERGICHVPCISVALWGSSNAGRYYVSSVVAWCLESCALVPCCFVPHVGCYNGGVGGLPCAIAKLKSRMLGRQL